MHSQLHKQLKSLLSEVRSASPEELDVMLADIKYEHLSTIEVPLMGKEPFETCLLSFPQIEEPTEIDLRFVAKRDALVVSDQSNFHYAMAA